MPRQKKKYGRIRHEPVVFQGIKFASKQEARRYFELSLLQNSGHIKNLRLQVSFDIAPPCVLDGKKKPARRYVADFVYQEGDKTVVEDTKGYKQERMFLLKRHLMMTVHGIEVRVV